MLHRIYVICHGETVDFAQNFRGEIYTPTGNEADVELSKVGREQSRQTAKQLAKENMPIDIVYSSPHYQCLETLRPIVATPDGKTKLPVMVENGFREWEDIDDVYPLCTGQCKLKRPTSLPILKDKFPFISTDYRSMVRMPQGGWCCEPPRRLLLRAHFTMYHIIMSLDRMREPKTILICTHAPIVLGIARILTARSMPVYSHFNPNYKAFLGAVRRKVRYISAVEFSAPDHHAAYCSISRFDRRSLSALQWTWKLSLDGDQSHLRVPNGTYRFRPSPWQNRHSPHPVLWACAFVRHLPASLLWGPQAIYTGSRDTVRELWTALQRQLRNNPYRLPAWVYMMLWLCLLLTLTDRLMSVGDVGHKWMYAKDSVEGLRGFRGALGNLGTILPQFALFMFPPLLA